MLNQMIDSFLSFTRKKEFTLLDYLVHIAVAINLIIAGIIAFYWMVR